MKRSDLAAFTLVFLALPALAGTREGGSGAGWGCVDPVTGIVEGLRFLDLYEAERGFYQADSLVALPLDTPCGAEGAKPAADCTEEDYLSDAKTKVARIHPAYAARLDRFLSRVMSPGFWPTVSTTLKKITDFGMLPPGIIQIPDPSFCSAPKKTAHLQIATYRLNGREIHVDLALEAMMTKRERAALRFHEAAYALAREERFATDSLESRKIVAFAFSKVSDERFREILDYPLPSERDSGKPRPCGSNGATRERVLQCNDFRKVGQDQKWWLTSREVKNGKTLREIWLEPDTFNLWGNVVDDDDSLENGFPVLEEGNAYAQRKASRLCGDNRFLNQKWSLPSKEDYQSALARGLMDVVSGLDGRVFWIAFEPSWVREEADPEISGWEAQFAFYGEKRAIQKHNGKAYAHCVSRANDILLE